MDPAPPASPISISLDAFRDDPHAARCVRALVANPAATSALFEILQSPASVQDMIGAERLDHPALSGVVGRIESHPAIRPLLEAGPAGLRFRQAVGVAVRLVMAQAGWHPAREKAPVRGAAVFRKVSATGWRPPPNVASGPLPHVLRPGTDEVVVATTNPSHLRRYVAAEAWSAI